ncbi:MAG: sugar nucleotide-binding protein, partial [Thalassolituus sp.]
MAISSFHTHVIGADRPVGRYLTRLLAEQNLIYRGVAIDSSERAMMQSSARPVYVVTPALNTPADIGSALGWIERAREEDALLVLVSTLHCYRPSAGAVAEDMTPDNDTELSEAFGILEEAAARHPQHIILRVGQLMTLEGDDFASRVLNHIRTEPLLALDMQKQFEPTPVDDLASVIVAVLRQVHLSDNLWGTYHFSGVEAVSSYGFAEALLSEARQFEDLSGAELTTQEGGMMPEIWSPVAEHTRLFYTFGIKTKPWRQGLSRMVKHYYQTKRAVV